MASLQDQLLKAGVVDSKKASKIKQEQRKEAKAQPKGQERVDQDKEQARVAREEKAARDKELNRHRQLEAEKKAVTAQIAQLIQMNRIDRSGGEIAYQFKDGTTIKKIYVTAQLQNDLVKGRVAIAGLQGRYEIIAASAAEKIRQRDEQVILVLNTHQPLAPDEDDPYAAYQVPDDLMW